MTNEMLNTVVCGDCIEAARKKIPTSAESKQVGEVDLSNTSPSLGGETE